MNGLPWTRGRQTGRKREICSTMEAESGDATSELSTLLDGVNLSAPSSVKFEKVKAWVAARIGHEPRAAAVYYVSRPGNFHVRFNQPGVARDRPIVGLALVPRSTDLGSYYKPAERLVASGPFEAMAVCSHDADDWRAERVFVRPGAGFDPTFGGMFGRDVVTTVRDDLPRSSERPYDGARFANETGLDAATAGDWLERLRRKGQIVIQGPPGTGKTWIAERLARLLVGQGRGIVDTVQFHPAYGYEDFVAGIAPVVSGGGMLSYETRPGRFLEFCDLARDAEGDPCVLVIDELNRADISRVFGEVMHLLEYREKSIRLANGPEDGRFSIPANVFVVATMNSADRSLALLDHALRRRFSFIRLGPQYGILRERLARDGLVADGLIALLVELNTEISDPDFEVGISFFMGAGRGLPAVMPAIWDGEIVPYVVEIMHARPDTRDRWSWSSVRGRMAAWYEDPEPYVATP